MSDDVGGPRPPLTTADLRDAKARLAAFAQWVAEASGGTIDRDGAPDVKMFRGLCFVSGAVHEELWRGRPDAADHAETTAKELFEQAFGLTDEAATELAGLLRTVQAKKDVLDLAQRTGDPANVAAALEEIDFTDPAVTEPWLDLARGKVIYAAWKAAPDGLPPAEYRKLVRHADRIRPSSGAPSALAGIMLLAFMFAAVMGVVYIFR